MKDIRKSPYYAQVQAGIQKLKIRGYQKKWLLDESRLRMALKARQTGFSYVLGLDAAISALLRGKNQLLGSASYDQSLVMLNYARNFLINDFGITLVADSEGKLELPNGRVIIAMPANYRTIQGFNGDVYFDEFAWNPHDKKIWRALIPSITAVGGHVSVVSTPYAKKGKFYELWSKENSYSKHIVDIYEALKDGLLPEGQTAEQFIKELQDALDDPEFFPSAYECQFIDDLESYLPFSLLEPLMQLDQVETHGQSLWLGVDVGRHKDIFDITAVGESPEGNKKEIRFNMGFHNLDYDKQKAMIIDLFRKHNIYHCTIDRTGIGDNLFESLKKLFPGKVTGVWFSAGIKEKMSIHLKNMLQREELLLLKDRTCAHHYSSIKRTATEKGFKYDTERNSEHGHADKYWSVALALWTLNKTRKMMRSRFVRTA